MTTTRSFRRRCGCFCTERCHGGVRRVCAPPVRWDDGTLHTCSVRQSCTTRSCAGSTIDARKERRRRTCVIDRSSVMAVILVPALLAAAAPPVVAQAPAQLQPSQLSLAEALRLALQQNQQLRVAAFEVAVARAQLAQSRAGGAIQGSVQGSYTRTEEGVSTSIPDSGRDVIKISPPLLNLYAAHSLIPYPP